MMRNVGDINLDPDPQVMDQEGVVRDLVSIVFHDHQAT